MHLPQIRMTSQMAQIQVQQTSARQEIRQPEAEMSIQQPRADISMNTRPSKLTIDQTEAWADMGLMPISERVKKHAEDGQQGVMEGIARRARQGTEMMKIEKGGDPLVSQAAANAYEPYQPLGMTFIPSRFAVKTNYEPSELQINVNVNKPVINNQPQEPDYTYKPGDVTTSMRQQPDLQIDFAHIDSDFS
ncbi:DUF6470 family protein [Barrientosiimonas marina]|uniref:DUF6470 family protein n=1 Tax=Lentibacillus kimchii TaxID=1542911 RepID=A0ABW2UWY9_9BACI